MQVVPNATSTGLDIGLSNRSLAYITVSFYTMCKSTVPLWLLCFAFLFRVEKPSWGLFGVMITISGGRAIHSTPMSCLPMSYAREIGGLTLSVHFATGLLLLVAGETQFHLLGFLMVMSAALLSGFRWTVTQILLQVGYSFAIPHTSCRCFDAPLMAGAASRSPRLTPRISPHIKIPKMAIHTTMVAKAPLPSLSCTNFSP